MLKSIVVFDIETIPDTSCCEPLTGLTAETSTEQRDALTQYHLDITDGKNPFLRQPFHKIVAISFLRADLTAENNHEYYSLQEVRSGGENTSTESEILKGWHNYIKKHNARLVSFNGRSFDIPVIKYRSMTHGIQAAYLNRSGDKWNNYNQRYSLDWHCDLLEALSDYGASARVKMNEVCAAFGIPGKLGTDGGDVTSMYDEGKITEIRNYCETDVINTYLIYLRFMHYRGHITTEGYNKNIKDLIHELEKEQKQHFLEFHLAWKKSCKGKFFL